MDNIIKINLTVLLPGRGVASKDNAALKSACVYQNMKISKEAYLYFIGEEQPYFSPKFLILKYLKMSEADLELNEKYKKEEELLKKLKGGDDGKDEEDTDSENGEDEGGEEDNIDLGQALCRQRVAGGSGR